MGCGEGSNSNCDGVDGEENHPKSQCYGFEQEMAVDEEKVVMVVAMKDRVISSLDELLTLGDRCAHLLQSGILLEPVLETHTLAQIGHTLK